MILPSESPVVPAKERTSLLQHQTRVRGDDDRFYWHPDGGVFIRKSRCSLVAVGGARIKTVMTLGDLLKQRHQLRIELRFHGAQIQ